MILELSTVKQMPHRLPGHYTRLPVRSKLNFSFRVEVPPWCSFPGLAPLFLGKQGTTGPGPGLRLRPCLMNTWVPSLGIRPGMSSLAAHVLHQGGTQGLKAAHNVTPNIYITHQHAKLRISFLVVCQGDI